MSLGHVYIVLEPIGFARLTFDDICIMSYVIDDRSLVGVPDEIGDMMRSLEMVET